MPSPNIGARQAAASRQDTGRTRRSTSGIRWFGSQLGCDPLQDVSRYAGLPIRGPNCSWADKDNCYPDDRERRGVQPTLPSLDGPGGA